MRYFQRVAGSIAVAVVLGVGISAATTAGNHAPNVPCLDIYRTYPGFPISLPVGGSDPDGNTLQYSTEGLPDGAQLDPGSGVFTWEPGESQLGPFYVPFTATDDGLPAQSTDGVLIFKVLPLDECSQPNCDPATGCTSTMIPLTQPCCSAEPTHRVAEPVAGCPQGRVLFIGRNQDFGFGRLQNCDRLKLISSGQVGQPSIRINLQVRCLNARQPITVHARMESSLADRGVVLDLTGQFRFDAAPMGFSEALLSLPLSAAGPFFDFQDSEAELSVDVTDVDGIATHQEVRVKLTTAIEPPPPDLPDVDATGPTPPALPCALAAATPSASPSPTLSTTSTPVPTDTATPTLTETITPSDTPTPIPTPTASLTATAIVNPTPSSTPTLCAGDCDGSGRVTEVDLLELMEIALGHAGSAACVAVVGDVTVVEMLTAVTSASRGCGAARPIH